MERPSSSAMQMLYAEMSTVKAQNVRLEEEVMLLRHRLNRASTDYQSNASLHVEAKVKTFQLEEERDRIVDTLQLHKKKYNKLHDAYLEKVKRCKALEDMFKRQKTLTGLVMKSAIDQRNSEQQMQLEKRRSQQNINSENEVGELQAKLAKMQKALDQSYDIIDEMDFELESVDLLEMQNKSLRDEVAALKAQLATPAVQSPIANDVDDPPPKYAEEDALRTQADRCESSGMSCLKIDDDDAASLERAAMTNSLIETVEAESHRLRRELLRSRYQRQIHDKLQKPVEEDEEDEEGKD
ncbi:ERC protein 2 [Drosophila grimshawi]|uniref:GH10430 n=1 Tax=Drosophila grimshawi TaxID=7222 RepID=B4JE49_DROGR|nr:ERC protein 2 [Drosophila grimshawi]EDW03569.1 GH10430 [Drosophila grimshawi]